MVNKDGLDLGINVHNCRIRLTRNLKLYRWVEEERDNSGG